MSDYAYNRNGRSPHRIDNRRLPARNEQIPAHNTAKEDDERFDNGSECRSATESHRRNLGTVQQYNRRYRTRR